MGREHSRQREHQVQKSQVGTCRYGQGTVELWLVVGGEVRVRVRGQVLQVPVEPGRPLAVILSILGCHWKVLIRGMTGSNFLFPLAAV